MTHAFPIPALTLIAMLAAPAAAQDSDAPCRATWDALAALFTGMGVAVTDPPDVVGVDGDLCSATHLTLGGARTRVSMARLGWQGLTAETFTDLALPEALLLTVDDLRVRNPLPGSPILGWAIDARQARDLIDLRLEATWDAQAGRLVVTEAAAEGRGDNRVVLAFALRGLYPETLRHPSPPLGDLVFEGLTAEIETNGLFERHALIPLARQILDAAPNVAPPARQFAELQSAWAREIRAVADAQLSPRSREALIEAIDALPNPSGLLTLVLSTGDGVGAEDIARLAAAEGESLAGLLSRVPQVTLAVSWQESAAEGP